MEYIFLLTTLLTLTLLLLNETKKEIQAHKKTIESQHALIEVMAKKLKEARGEK
ncbi:hypothetical protein ACLIA0_12940 [Bacillaceae bacterium W0354]